MPLGINFKHELNKEQYNAVTAPDGPVAVIAGAGSGKTRTIVYRVAYLLDKDIQPEEILLLTFTNKAAKEMIHRLQELVGARITFHGLWAGTFHSICNRILRLYGDRLGYTSSFTILDHDDSRALIKTCMKSLGIETAAKRGPSPAVVQEIVSYTKNAQKSLADVIKEKKPSLIAFTKDVLKTAEMYDQRKREMNAMDFDDLLANTLELVIADESICAMLRARFKYILVDEYQDTSPVQAALIRKIADKDGNLFVVGDDCQSIYAFRAAEVKNILEFKKYHPNAKICMLNTNYRSTPQIVSLANDIIEKNTDQFQKELSAVRKDEKPPHIIPFPSAVAEASFIADTIEEHIGSGQTQSEFAVLFRATHHSQALEFELMKRGINYEYRGGQRFFERSHIKDVLAFLRLIANVRDEPAWLRTAVLWEGIGENAAIKIAYSAREALSLATFVVSGAFPKMSARANKGLTEFVTLLRDIVAAPTPKDAINAIIASPYIAYLEAEFPNAADRIADVEQLAVFAERYPSLSEFLTDVTLDDAIATQTQNPHHRQPLVVLSTIHQAKGLEWDTVVLMHLAAGNFPNKRSLDSKADLEEERRLFYVAVTRAKRKLYMTYPLSGGGYSSYGSADFGMAQPSLFLTELSRTNVKWGEDNGNTSSSHHEYLSHGRSGITSKPNSSDPFWEEESIDLGF